MEALVGDNCMIFIKLIIIVTIHPEKHQGICMVMMFVSFHS